MADFLARTAKAFTAGGTAALAALIKGITDDGKMSTNDWIFVVGSFLVVGVLTWLVPNRQPSLTPKRF